MKPVVLSVIALFAAGSAMAAVGAADWSGVYKRRPPSPATAPASSRISRRPTVS